MKSLYDLIGNYWAIVKNKKKRSTESLEHVLQEEDPIYLSPTYEVESESDEYGDAQLADMLGVHTALPVEPCPESQVPPDSMAFAETEPVDQAPGSSPSHSPRKEELPTLEDLEVSTPEITDGYGQVATEESPITPTEIEVTPPTAKNVAGLSSSPAPFTEEGVSVEDVEGAKSMEDLASVRLRIENLKYLSSTSHYTLNL